MEWKLCIYIPEGSGGGEGGMEGRGAEGEEGSKGIVVVHTEIIRGPIPGPSLRELATIIHEMETVNLLSSP